MGNNAFYQVPVKANAEKPNCKHSRLVYKNQSANVKPVCADSRTDPGLTEESLTFLPLNLSLWILPLWFLCQLSRRGINGSWCRWHLLPGSRDISCLWINSVKKIHYLAIKFLFFYSPWSWWKRDLLQSRVKSMHGAIRLPFMLIDWDKVAWINLGKMVQRWKEGRREEKVRSQLCS